MELRFLSPATGLISPISTCAHTNTHTHPTVCTRQDFAHAVPSSRRALPILTASSLNAPPQLLWVAAIAKKPRSMSLTFIPRKGLNCLLLYVRIMNNFLSLSVLQALQSFSFPPWPLSSSRHSINVQQGGGTSHILTLPYQQTLTLPAP